MLGLTTFHLMVRTMQECLCGSNSCPVGSVFAPSFLVYCDPGRGTPPDQFFSFFFFLFSSAFFSFFPVFSRFSSVIEQMTLPPLSSRIRHSAATSLAEALTARLPHFFDMSFFFPAIRCFHLSHRCPPFFTSLLVTV